MMGRGIKMEDKEEVVGGCEGAQISCSLWCLELGVRSSSCALVGSHWHRIPSPSTPLWPPAWRGTFHKQSAALELSVRHLQTVKAIGGARSPSLLYRISNWTCEGSVSSLPSFLASVLVSLIFLKSAVHIRSSSASLFLACNERKKKTNEKRIFACLLHQLTKISFPAMKGKTRMRCMWFLNWENAKWIDQSSPRSVPSKFLLMLVWPRQHEMVVVDKGREGKGSRWWWSGKKGTSERDARSSLRLSCPLTWSVFSIPPTLMLMRFKDEKDFIGGPTCIEIENSWKMKVTWSNKGKKTYTILPGGSLRSRTVMDALNKKLQEFIFRKLMQENAE